MNERKKSKIDFFCILSLLQDEIHILLKKHPWRSLDNIDFILDIDEQVDGSFNLRIDVSAEGNRPLSPSYDEVVASLIDEVKSKFEEMIREGVCETVDSGNRHV